MKTARKANRNFLRRVRTIVLITMLCFLGLGTLFGYTAAAITR